jgi:hypothetical protein
MHHGCVAGANDGGREQPGWWPTSPSSRWAGRSTTPASWPPTTRRTCPATASPQAAGTAPSFNPCRASHLVRRNSPPSPSPPCPAGCSPEGGRDDQPPAAVMAGGDAFDTCCFAGELRSLLVPPDVIVARALDHTLVPALIPTHATRVPLVGRRKDHRWLCPTRGSGAAAPQGALRAIDSTAHPRSWRTCGPRRLRRQSRLALLTTHRGAVALPGRVSSGRRPC